MRKNLGGLILVLLLACPRVPAWAQGLPLGTEFQVNTYTTGSQKYPAVATDPSGNFVVVWMSNGQDGSDWGVFGQRFASNGTPLGTEFQVNTYTTGYQGTYPSSDVATDGAGNFVVVWHSRGQDGSFEGVFGQRFSNTGARVGTEFQVNTYTRGPQDHPRVASTATGNFVVLWQSDQDGSDLGVFGQRFDNTGAPLGSEFQVNTYTTGDQRVPAVALDAAGNFVVVWHSPQDGSFEGVFGQRFDSNGTPVGTEFQVNTYTTGNQEYAAVGSDASGNFVVVWRSGCGNNQDGGGCGVFGQRFASTGARVGTEFQVNTYTTENQFGSASAMAAAGNFVVAWESVANQDGSGYGVFGQRFASSGAPVGSEFQINTYTTGDQGSYPISVAASPHNFVVVWHDGSGEDGSSYGIFGQRFSPLVPPPAPTPAEHVAPALGPASLILLCLGLVFLGSAVVVRKRRRV